MPADRPRVVVMNDTSGRSHHGCARVMRLLIAGLERQGLSVTARSAAHGDWSRDAAFMAALGQADLVVINGEGTLHHGKPAGERLLSVIDHPARGATPVALINALWQDNPPEWAGWLDRAALIATRDSRSAAVLAAQLGTGRVRHLPDLSLTDGPAPQPGPRDRLIVGDAVRLSTRRALARAARRLHADAIIPTKTRAGGVWSIPPLRATLGAAYLGTHPFGLPPLQLPGDEPAYLAALGRARMHLTGRFHAICLSLVTGTPFLAVASNSWKIEALLADAGLPSDRILDEAALQTLRPADLDRPFSARETDGIAAFLARAQAQAEALFADLATLARQGRA